jgi:carboxymethylenebutenolidase
MLPTRRDVVTRALASGFALAVAPIAETALATDAHGLEAGDVKIPVAGGELPGYRAAPSGNPKLKAPVLLVVHEIFGVHEHIKDLCRRFAKLGFYAVAPDLFHRQGDATQIPDMKQLLAKIVSKAPDSQVLDDLDATLGWARAQPTADAGRASITGFCWGGRISWLYAAHQPALKAAVAWYGKLDGERDALHPKFPIDLVADLKAPVLGLYGGMDRGIPLDTIGRMKQALAGSTNQVAGKCEFHIYAEAGHAFAADYRPSYRKADAEDGVKRLRAWLKQHGAA